ncbi:MAG: DNA polymerase III subunit beta [Patescibacteria group bacterium]|jgi:DNA polymerase-3 subunit beta
MKISCTQENLNQGLLAVSHIANKNTNLPILSNLLFKIENKTLTLEATNLEIGITANIRSKVEEDGEFSVDARLLANYIALLPKERIDFELDGDNLKIECQKQKTKIKTQSASEFPLIPKIVKENPCIVDIKAFKQAISEVVFSASNSESRPELSGVFVSFTNNELVMAATDSYRLAEKKISLIENKYDKKIIIPVKTLQEISRILSIFREDTNLESAENMEIYLTDNQIMFSYNGIDLVSRLVEGQYPDYTQIIPTNHKTKAKINVAELIKNIKTSSLFTRNGIFDIKLDLNVNSKEVVITSSSSQSGENISVVGAEITGENESIILNYRYLLDNLQIISSDFVDIEIGDVNSPCVIKSENDDKYIYIIMPIRQ